ncbi:hypothetical protein CcaverHIS631_0503240 [Cutaneotrichosporon cavernicola]|nr:hypothetical protein CcaverHIS631_0503240 [Cutaneotrichosporon cavernicola]
MATIVKTLLKSAMPKDKANKKKDKDKGGKMQARSAHFGLGPSLPPKPLGGDLPRAPTWIDNAPPARDKVGPWIQAHAVYTVDSHLRYEYPEAPPAIPSRTNSPAVTVLPQESISVIGVGRGVPRGHQSMQSFSALQEPTRKPPLARPLSETMSRGAPVYQPQAVTNSPTMFANPRPLATPRVFSRSADPEATPKPHLHQPKPEHPFNYAKAQETHDRELRHMAKLADAEAEQRRVDIIAAKEAAQDAAELARLAHQQQSEEIAYRDLQRMFGAEDTAARREIDQAFATQNEKTQAEIDEVRERQDAYDAAFARLHAPLTAGNRQDKHDLKWEHVFSAADMRPREARDTFSTESFGHMNHADGKPIPAPLIPVLPSLKPATVINETKVVKRSSKPKRKEKHCHTHTHTPAELLQTMELTRNLTLVKTINANGHEESDSETDAVSQITRLTNIAKLVDDSTFHDDTLCQLLDAARLNLIGDQAKKALMHAARTRVDELSRQLLEGSRNNNTPPLVIRKKQRHKTCQPTPGIPDVLAPAVPMTPAARAVPLPEPVTPAPLPALPLSAQLAANATPSPSKNEEAITELLGRMTTLMEAFQSQKNNRDVDMSRGPGPFTANGTGSFPPPQVFPLQSVPLVTPDMLPHGTFPFRSPDYQPPPECYPKFQEQPCPESTSREISTSGEVGPNGYIPTGGLADEYMMGGGSFTSSPKATGSDPTQVPLAQAPTEVSRSGKKSEKPQVSKSEKSQVSKAPTEASRATSKRSKAATQVSKPATSKAPTNVSKAPTRVSRAPSQSVSQVASSVRTPTGPIINIFSPTTVNGDPTQSRAMSNVPPTPTKEQPAPSSRGTSVQSQAAPEPPRSPRSHTPGQVVVLERDLPPLPESVTSYFTRSTAKRTSANPQTTISGSRVGSRVVSGVSNVTTGTDYDSAGRTAIVTRIVVRDGLSPALDEVRPWDIVVGRLHAMAAVWQEDSFVRAMSSISLKRELDIVPLTIYTMNIYKSYLRNRLTALKPLPFDKLLVSPVHAETINSFIFAKKYNEAAAILVNLWAPLSKEPPRVIITMTKHGYQEGWLAHRWDLATGHLTSHHCIHIESQIDPYDKRPFNWWHAIRAAFPQRGILEPRHLLERNVRHVYTASPSDNSLRAALVTRNLLNGNKGDVDHGLGNLRDTVWRMTQQLLKKKQAGELLTGLDEA